MYTMKKAQGVRPVRALILTGDLGDGHRQAAMALAEACGHSDSSVHAEIADYMREVYALAHPFMKYCFLKGVEKAPSLYGYLYRRSRMKEELSTFSRTFLRLGSSKLLELLHMHRSELIVSTFPLASAAVSLLKEQRLVHAPLVTVITDYADHALWIQPHTDLYVVGSAHVAHALRERGIAEERIQVTGIPIRSRFYNPSPPPAELKQRLGLDPLKPLVLVMGGGGGLLSDEARRLVQSEVLLERAQLAFLCGSNEAVRQELTAELQPAYASSVRVEGFVDNIEQWMGAATLLVTKPGGLTTSEAAAMKLPMLLYRPIPGQEEENAAVLEKSGVAVCARPDRRLLDQLLELLESPRRLEEMSRHAEAFCCGLSAELAWEAALELLQGRSAKSAEHPGWTAAGVREQVLEA
ncbi:MGDG synthase family glycosyltransferase [Paenibacillus sp. YYML68]|uniref:MGDG synthase family glycosyltransferase n=1 Tax=Paenibacillus sp. YYML68 TaxID=2909250 RepID=UPI00248F6862|nr:glycosyltransferase [Paenibacillus sp. YYML68]